MNGHIDRRQAMLDEGRRLILTQGYTATSVGAVCDAGSVTKGRVLPLLHVEG